MSTAPARILCVGEALVDLVGERRGVELAEIEYFSRHLGGVAANIALVAARAGADVALAGGAGDDAWGGWLTARLQEAGVDLSLFELLPGMPTPLAFVTVDDAGDPRYELHGDGSGTVVRTLEGRVEQVVRDSAAVFLSTNTLAGEPERQLTMEVRQCALELRRPVVFDAGLRIHRWRSADEAAACARACIPGSLLVRANLVEAQTITGERDPERAAEALLAAGATLVVLTQGSRGAILRGTLRSDVAAVDCDVVNTAGAGDVLTGTLLAALARHRFSPAAVAAALPDAVVAAARACETWGAVD